MPHWTVHRLLADLGQHAMAWDALNQRLYGGHALLDSRFVGGLLQHFGNGTERLCVLESEGEPQAMCILRPNGFGVWSSFLPVQAQIGSVLLQKPISLASLMRGLPGFATRLELLCTDPVYSDFSSFQSIGLESLNHSLTMNIRLEGGFNAYWAGRSKNLSKNIDRYSRRLESDKISRKFLHLSTPAEIGPAIERYAVLESKGWKGEQGTAIEIGSTQGNFYAQAMNQFAATGHAAVFELWFDTQLAASRLVIESGNMLVILKTTYDETFDKYAPGRLLLHDVVQQLFITHPGKTLEFYTHANLDQLAWATGQRWIKHVSMDRSTLMHLAYQVTHVGRRLLAPVRTQIDRTDSDIAIYKHPDEFPPDVKSLFDRAEEESVELSTHWYRNLVNSVYPGDRRVRFFVLRKHARPIAALAVRTTRGGFGQQLESLSNYYTSIFSPQLVEGLKAADLAPLICAVKADCPPLSTLRLAPMDPESYGFQTLFKALEIAGLVPFKFFCFGNWYLQVQDDWPTYFKTREGSVRSTIKRAGKKFALEGGRLELIAGHAELEKALAAYLQVYALSWKQAEPFPDFIPGLMKACADNDWLRLGVAWLGDKPIAAQLWIVAHGKASIYKLAYDENFKAYAPGTLLTAMLMEHAMEKDKVTEIDYLIGDDPYKKAWMNRRRERWGIIAYNPRTWSGMIGLCREIASRSVKMVVRSLKKMKTTSLKA